MANMNVGWWQSGVIYQIYPRSFQDSNGDGIGDLAGILQRVDYLADLAVDAVWISPFFPSPMADFGYDVADYCDVDPLFGTLDDFDRLIAAIHKRGMRLILDFVPNHTSSQHPWFLQSRASRLNPRRDWYLWRNPGPDGGPPNNWQSHFGGPAWTLDEATGQYYCHSFLKEQPDLNWWNPDVRQAMYAALRFWLDKGVDGFRVDVLWLLIKDPLFRDNPPNPDWHPGQPSIGSVLPKYTADQPETHHIVAEMRALLDEYSVGRMEPSHEVVRSPTQMACSGQCERRRVLIGEIYLPLPDLVRYYGPNLTGAQMPFNFRLIQTAWNAESIASLIVEYESLLPPGAWPNWVLGNHDQMRLATRVGTRQARVAAVLLLTLRGTPTLYYGDELGLPNASISPEQVVDPAEKNQPGIGQGRDPERAPMIWDSTPLAGFTAGTPWLPFAADPAECSVAAQSPGMFSVLTLYRRLLTLRRNHAALQLGSISNVYAHNGVLSYVREFDGERFQVLLNLTSEIRRADFGMARMLFSSFLDRDDETNDTGTAINLRPDEAIVLRLIAPGQEAPAP